MERDPRKGAGRQLATVLGVLLLVVLLPIVVPVLLGWGAYSVARGLVLVWRFRRTFGAQGKVGVLVYSDSPHWKEHVESRILPRVGARLVTVKWSRRAQWPDPKPVEVSVFEHWAGSRAFNPMAIIVRGYGRVQTIRFFEAFKASRHGRPDELRRAEERLLEAVEAA